MNNKRWTNTHKLVSLFLREKARSDTLRYSMHIEEQKKYNMLDIACGAPRNGERKIMNILRVMLEISKR